MDRNYLKYTASQVYNSLKLWELLDERYTAQAVKHRHTPQEDIKYLGNIQTRYPKKNWSSVLLFNNSKCKVLTPEYINTASGLDLHQFKWVQSDELIGALPLRWNFLVDYYANIPLNEISLLHWTKGGCYFSEYENCSYADVWRKEYKSMTNVMRVEEKV